LTEERGVGLKGWLSGPGRKDSKTHLVSPVRLSKYRVAVLPLSNISPDPQDEYFADGMTEEVISKVSRIEGLEVISRTSVMQYKKTPKPVREVGRELDVGTVLEGSVRKAGSKLRISVQMIDAEKDRHIWSEDYDRTLQDVFAIQSEIAKQIADALQVRLLLDNKKRLEKSPTSNVEAYTLYLKARPSISRQDKEAFDLAIRLYEQAVAKDPKFALAYAGLARSYSGLAFHGYLPSKIAGAKARTYASKALEIDDSLSEAHRVMGGILRNFDWDIAGAEREFKRAIELNQSLAEAHSSLGILLMFKRETEAAISEAKRAMELDPLSGDTLGAAGTVYLYLGMNDDAIEQFSKALALDPRNNYARNNLGLSQVRKGALEEGIREMEQIKVESGRSPSMWSDLAYVYAKAGRIEDVRKLLSDCLNEVETNHELAVAIASAYAGLGDRDRAIEWLERAYSEHVTVLISANADFVFDSIRMDPRFQSLMRKLGFTILS
jgi:TolB-like protein/Flp pilus assembly protein TadD